MYISMNDRINALLAKGRFLDLKCLFFGFVKIRFFCLLLVFFLSFNCQLHIQRLSFQMENIPIAESVFLFQLRFYI